LRWDPDRHGNSRPAQRVAPELHTPQNFLGHGSEDDAKRLPVETGGDRVRVHREQSINDREEKRTTGRKALVREATTGEAVQRIRQS